MALELLIEEAKGLSDDALMEVVRYMRMMKMYRASQVGNAAPAGSPGRKYRTAGKYRGQIVLSQDFDTPLEDFREYM